MNAWRFVIAYLLCVAAPVEAGKIGNPPKLVALWTTEGLAVPESVLFYQDKASALLFVAQIDGEAKTKDGKGAIATLSTTGKIQNLNWVSGLNAPKGMASYKQKLYVADIDQIVVIDIALGQVSHKIDVPGAQFLNDVAIDQQGTVYVTDTQAQRIYRVHNDKPEIYLDNIANANGIKVIDKDLIVGSGTEVLKIDHKKNIQVFAKGFTPNVDGIEPLSKGDYLISVWLGNMYYVGKDGSPQLILDTSAAKINSADIGYDPATRQVFVPTFLKNSVSAYQLQ